WHIGDYAVTASTLNGPKVRTKSNLFNTQSGRHSVTRFTFVLRDAADSATVSAVWNAADDSTHHARGLLLTGESLIQASDTCVASIVVGDTAETWKLTRLAISAPPESLGVRVSLTNGVRTMDLNPVFWRSKDKNESRSSFFSRLTAHMLPGATGYDIVEDGRSIGALKRYGGGPRGGDPVVWMLTSLDPRSKL